MKLAALVLASGFLYSCNSHFQTSLPTLAPSKIETQHEAPVVGITDNDWCGPHAIYSIMASDGLIPKNLDTELPLYQKMFGGLSPKDMAEILSNYGYDAEVINFSDAPREVLQSYLQKDYKVAALVREPKLKGIKRLSQLHWVTVWGIEDNTITTQDNKNDSFTQRYRLFDEDWSIDGQDSYLGVVAKLREPAIIIEVDSRLIPRKK